MSLKMTFLGTGSAFTIGEGNFHSNVLLEVNYDTLLLDIGSDVRFALNEQNKSYKDIRNIYISHMHNDHIGGLEWMALTSFFDPNYQGKPRLFASENIIVDLWKKSLSGGLSTLTTQCSTLQTYFIVQPISRHGLFNWQNILFKLVQMVHVFSDFKLMPCYGLLFEYQSTRIFFTADTQFVSTLLFDLYQQADIIFHDCETSQVKSGVHAHYSQLLQIPAEYKNKMWLYHYNPGKLPDARADGFLGFVSKGQCFNF